MASGHGSCTPTDLAGSAAPRGPLAEKLYVLGAIGVTLQLAPGSSREWRWVSEGVYLWDS